MISRPAFKVWLSTSIVWIIALGIMVYAGGIFPAYFQTNFPLRADLEPWQQAWSTSGPLRKPLYEIIRSPAAEKLDLEFTWRGYQGPPWNQHIHAREMPSYKFPSGETLDLPAELTDADRDYVKNMFWDRRWHRWKEILGPFAKAAVVGPLLFLAALWVARRLRAAISGKAPAPEAPRLPYSPAMERLRTLTLYASGIEILLWLVVGAITEIKDPQSLLDALSLLGTIMLPSIAAFVMSVLRRGPRTAAALAVFGLYLLVPLLVTTFVPQSWLPK